MPSWRTGNRNLPPKEQGGPPPKFFHPAMMALFKPDPPLEFVTPPSKDKRPDNDGLAKYLQHFEKGPPPPRKCDETPKQTKERLKLEKEKKRAKEIENGVEAYEKEKEEIKGDPYKTIFVGRLSYDVDERKLRREFDRYGPIHSITMIEDRSKNPRGYAFIQFESEKDMREALKRMDGAKINGRRIIVDVERGRTVQDWKPRRLGGGRGDTRKSRPKKQPGDERDRYSGRMYERSRYGDDRRQDRYRDYRRRDDRGRRDDRRRDDRDRDDRRRDRRDDRYSSSSSRRRYRSRSRSRERGGYRRSGGYRR